MTRLKLVMYFAYDCLTLYGIIFLIGKSTKNVNLHLPESIIIIKIRVILFIDVKNSGFYFPAL